MLLDILEDLQKQTGFIFDDEKGVHDIVSCSDDFFDARTISDNGVCDAIGGHYRGEDKMAQEGLNGIGYAMAMILSDMMT
jgi:acetyl-CoA C-acetyltransferase